MSKGLTIKQQKFADEYIITGNIYRSAVQKFIERAKNKNKTKVSCYTNPHWG